MLLKDFVKSRRKETGLTQPEFADRAGVALTVLRKIEQGKLNLNMDKVNIILAMFGHELGPVAKERGIK
ncbi:MAG: helix-turn-helix domain-containing protein [Bacteroidia bacterium]|nr:helix-turn-helix domain-containing protein [Bacteroidia bacterium]